VPTLDPVAFLELPQARQDKLVGDGIATMVQGIHRGVEAERDGAAVTLSEVHSRQ